MINNNTRTVVPKNKTDRYCNLKTGVCLIFYFTLLSMFFTLFGLRRNMSMTHVSPVYIMFLLFFFSQVLFTHLPTILISSFVFIKIQRQPIRFLSAVTGKGRNCNRIPQDRKTIRVDYFQ